MDCRFQKEIEIVDICPEFQFEGLGYSKLFLKHIKSFLGFQSFPNVHLVHYEANSLTSFVKDSRQLKDQAMKYFLPLPLCVLS